MTIVWMTGYCVNVRDCDNVSVTSSQLCSRVWSYEVTMWDQISIANKLGENCQQVAAMVETCNYRSHEPNWGSSGGLLWGLLGTMSHARGVQNTDHYQENTVCSDSIPVFSSAQLLHRVPTYVPKNFDVHFQKDVIQCCDTQGSYDYLYLRLS